MHVHAEELERETEPAAAEDEAYEKDDQLDNQCGWIEWQADKCHGRTIRPRKRIQFHGASLSPKSDYLCGNPTLNPVKRYTLTRAGVYHAGSERKNGQIASRLSGLDAG